MISYELPSSRTLKEHVRHYSKPSLKFGPDYMALRPQFKLMVE